MEGSRTSALRLDQPISWDGVSGSGIYTILPAGTRLECSTRSQVDVSWTTAHVHQQDLSMGIGAFISLISLGSLNGGRRKWLKRVLTS